MKKIILYIISILFFCGCNDLLDKYPLDQVTESAFWTSAKDVELYSNKFYTCFPDHRKNNYKGGAFSDEDSDNEFRNSIDWMNGTRTVPAIAKNTAWTWTNIRDINYFFANYTKVTAPFEAIKHYVGEMYFFKAWYYFELLKAYGDLPWYNEVLQMDSEGLYAPRVSRSIIADSICANLDKAALYLAEQGSQPTDRFSKDLAYAFKARVCLYEGTWEKYHANTPFGVEGKDGSSFLQQAVDACEVLMKKGYTLYTYADGGDYVKNYQNLFNQSDYSSIKEVLFHKKYSSELNYTHSIDYHGWDSYITLDLVNAYLCNNGEPIFVNGQKNPNYAGEKNLVDYTTNRDPRLQALLFVENEPSFYDYSTNQVTQRMIIKLKGDKSTLTGFNRKKGSSMDQAQYGNNAGFIAAITMRYAEVLLIYAEAKAELNTLTQSDLDQSINLLRKRVGMPSMQTSIPYVDSNWQFPELSPLLNEIRRERRVELAFEGMRKEDLCRWAAAEELIIGKRTKGFYFNQSMYPDILPGKEVYIDENNHLDPLQLQAPQGFGFNPERDYLSPIPEEELVLNKNLKQNPGW